METLQILEQLRTWGILTVSVFGLIGNVLCIIVSLHRDMKSSPVIVLIIGLAFSDSAFLIMVNINLGLGELVGYKPELCKLRDILLREVMGFTFGCSTHFIVVIT